jgi:hypothetical protein
VTVWSKFKTGNHNPSEVVRSTEDRFDVITRFGKEKLIDVNKNKPPYGRITVANSVRIGKSLSASVFQKSSPWNQDYFPALNGL